MNAKQFYAEKLDLLLAAQSQVAVLRQTLSDLSSLEDSAPDPSHTDLYELCDMLDTLEEAVDDLAGSVEPLAQ